MSSINCCKVALIIVNDSWDPFNGIMKNVTPCDDISVDERFSRLAKEIKLYHRSIEFLTKMNSPAKSIRFD
jgi:hypothetical protein